MKYRIIDIGREYKWARIDNLSEARNRFIKELGDDEYILFVDSDEEAPQMLKDYIAKLPPTRPYYLVRRINLVEGKYQPLQNPFYKKALMSNKVRYVGHPHEKVVPDRPYGLIDIPIIHNHTGPTRYTNPTFYNTRLFRTRLALKKVKDILLYGHVDPTVL